MDDEPVLKEYEVYYTRTVHTYVRVAAPSEEGVSDLAAQRLEEAELALCARCAADDVGDIQVMEDEPWESSVTEITDPTEHVVIEHDFDLVESDDDEDDEDDEDDDDD